MRYQRGVAERCDVVDQNIALFDAVETIRKELKVSM